MKSTQKNSAYTLLLTIVLFVFVFIGIIVYTNYYTNKNITSLRSVNIKAALTFETNNRLEALVYYLDAVDKNENKRLFLPGSLRNLNDTLQLININIDALSQSTFIKDTSLQLPLLLQLINRQLLHVKNKSTLVSNAKTSSQLLKDSIYNYTLQTQKLLELDLKTALYNGSKISKKIANLNMLLTIMVILVVALLATIIIARLLSQINLIQKLTYEKERADNSVKIKEQFLANMSHEIRTPINGILGFSNLLQKTDLLPNQKEFADLIQQSSNNLLYVVNDILDVSKMEAGMLRISNNPFSITKTCLEIEAHFYYKIKEKNIGFELNIQSTLPNTVIGDSHRLNQMLVNLVNNAVKFTNVGTVSLTVTFENEEDSAKVTFAIKDTGIGIPTSKINTIFKRFEQANDDTAILYGGTGLGLNIVNQLVQLQQGTIQVESTENVGSTFAITIPYGKVIRNSEILNETKTSNNNYENINHNATNNYKILVVEDNKVNQVLIKHMLLTKVSDVTIVNNGEEALELLKNNKYALILMDIQMPVINGYECTTAIRNVLKLNTPIIAMTAHVLPTEIEKCTQVGMQGFLGKPLEEVALNEILKKYIKVDFENDKKHLQQVVDGAYTFVNVKYLNEIFSHNKEYIHQILYLFKQHYPTELQKLENIIEQRNETEIDNLIHYMKTTVTSVHIKSPLKKYLIDIETANQERNWELMQTALTQLKNLKPRVLDEVNLILTSE